MDGIDQEIERIDQGGDACGETDEVVDVQIRRPLNAVVPLRLSAETWQALRDEASYLGVAPSTLVRMWVLEKLRAVARTTRSA
jgi:hypothetical protein